MKSCFPAERLPRPPQGHNIIDPPVFCDVWDGPVVDPLTFDYTPFHLDAGVERDEIKVQTACLPFADPAYDDIYMAVQNKMLEVNDQFWKLDITTWNDELRINQSLPGDFFGWHTDYTDYDDTKLSFSLCLREAEGGDVVFRDQGAVHLQEGEFIVFPGCFPHRQLVVTEGERYHLLGWLGGPRFI